MCGRYTITSTKEELEGRFDAHFGKASVYKSRYNAAPSQSLPVILNTDAGEIRLAEWGFVPHWKKKESKIRPQINARAETIALKPFFRDSFRRRRCLVLADSFFEWDKKGPKKIPYRFTLENNKPFAFAGIWDDIVEKGEIIPTFSIITTSANKLVSKIHDRMPVILKQEDESDWLDPNLDATDAESLLLPLPASQFQIYAISTQVNSPINDNPSVLVPVRAEER